jgi:hypothetical protein
MFFFINKPHDGCKTHINLEPGVVVFFNINRPKLVCVVAFQLKTGFTG